MRDPESGIATETDNPDNKIVSNESTSGESNNYGVCKLTPISNKSAVSAISRLSKSDHEEKSPNELDDEDIAKYIDDDEDDGAYTEKEAIVCNLDNNSKSPRLINYLTKEPSEKEAASCDLLSQSAYYRRMRLATASTLDIPVSLKSKREKMLTI